jgi:hypothetical protein
MILKRQQKDGSWHYLGRIRQTCTGINRDPLETFRQFSTQVKKHGRAVGHLAYPRLAPCPG